MNLTRMIRSLGLFTVSNPILPNSVVSSVLRSNKIRFEPGLRAIDFGTGANAASCISIDFDHFGAHYDSSRMSEGDAKKLEDTRIGTKLLLELSRKYEIPMTWAICGRTAELARESYQSITNCGIKHEIAIHTYRHVDVTTCTPEQFEMDVRKCIEVLGLHKAPSTFVFPWDRDGQFEVLRNLGFKDFRGTHKSIGIPHKTDDELWSIPAAYYVDYYRSRGGSSLIKRYMDVSIAHDSVFHMHTHPWSLVAENANSVDSLFVNLLDPVLKYMSMKMQEGSLACLTMEDVVHCMEENARRSK